ncbi:LysM peptidoglycan-binding domain-containing protein [Rhodophyticola porphyridii]|uniref:LysM peptidoglycan-binding domain-containing protein n=1 Tax=Rhodophyticola porphyridii TaxID=1852017 RepID=A0A3L9XXZ0_9RHOB|nr:LysM peptidoglycan-binding domain-containing protein [Rhodophyticola porphyridii]RMA41374.1 LysM peptidoglycan-binding domain-containing protein [Rhodophyticola porphyridii]
MALGTGSINSGSALAIGVGAAALAGVIGIVIFSGLLGPDQPEGDGVPAPLASLPAADAPQAEDPASPVVVSTTVLPEPQGETRAAAATADEAEAAAAAAGAPQVQIRPLIDLLRVDPTGSTIVAGRAAPGAEVTLMLDGVALDTVTADEWGAFVAMVSVPPAEMPRALSLSMVEDTDGPPVASEESIIITPTAAWVAAAGPTPAGAESAPEPLSDSGAEDVQQAGAAPEPPAAPRSPTLLIADDRGVRVLQPADQAPAVLDQIVLDTITYDPAGEVVLSGRGQADSGLQVYLDNQPVRLAEVDAVGQWRAALPEVDPGTYTLRVDQVDAAGQVVSRVETPFLREEPAVLAALPGPDDGVSVVTVQPGFTLWGIARETLGAGILYVQVYQANQDLIRDPDLIYPGQVFAIPEMASE